MKTFYLLFVASVLMYACKEQNKDPQPVIHDTISISEETARIMNYPVLFKEVLKAHGGLERWSEMKNLCFEFSKLNGAETHTVSLPDRRTKIESEKWSIGFNGKDIWLLQNQEEAYKDNPIFYHNLMFYFYAMPFVLGDKGLSYEEVKGTELDGDVYEGIKISFDPGIGNSPNDEYIIYYHPETHQMEWLGYTVTYNENTSSDEWRFIKYSEWQEVNGLKLPKTLTWYNVENGKPIQARNNVNFEKVTITETKLDDSVFEIPEGSKVINR
ncbi:MAG: DUF4292 domain-containing protein [Bacteroidia bacterium]|nr:DUF4292 domain-containing protein [Bacteroidia bacterium]NNF30155.1 hypothetical protein [Flavobacteriaceae bacterium]MBT8275033.1 DUF4292 domain-containing protein [Bacteroidia bacterium]NNJ81071.1 hypothetical protein [Flavobacteriaceae bacterium]NNK55481.1 hypothetical protein [Flavobacteriaceae bacterium]